MSPRVEVMLVKFSLFSLILICNIAFDYFNDFLRALLEVGAVLAFQFEDYVRFIRILCFFQDCLEYLAFNVRLEFLFIIVSALQPVVKHSVVALDNEHQVKPAFREKITTMIFYYITAFRDFRFKKVKELKFKQSNCSGTL